MKKLPLGRQTFRDLIDENLVYVDKTKDIYNLLTNDSKYFFLSRPRRFGKSLLVSTLEEIFSGNKELFKDLFIYDKFEFKKYPIIKIDFTEMLYTHGVQGLEDSILHKIKNIASINQINLKSNNYKNSFQELIESLSNNSEQKKVVLLIDEYDKPIIEYINKLDKVQEIKDILKNFYETIKASDKYVKFCFLTGVSKFSKISIFSGLNNITDITLDKNFSTMLGYTQSELEFYFSDRIKLLSEELNLSFSKAIETLKTWYNGYSWDGEKSVYNPFSILNVLKDNTINNYWFQSGTPTLLINLIKDKEIDITKFENKVVSSKFFESFEIENIEIESLLFQTGYLTIKEIKDPKSPFRRYILNYPNMEVKESLFNNILSNFSENNDNDSVLIFNILESLNKNNLEVFFDIFKNIFSKIPSIIFMSDKEAYYQTIIYLILSLIGVRVKTEVWTNKGRIDAVVETDDNIYIFEFKMSNYNQAIKQIENKKYYESYLLSNKSIYLVGASFDSESRNIKDWNVKSLNK